MLQPGSPTLLRSVYVIFMLERVRRTGSVHITNNAALSLNHCSRRKALSMKYFDCVSVHLLYFSGTQITSFLRHIILLHVACPAVPYFPTLFRKRHDLEKKNLNIKFVF
jgi:hypothetical protein